MEHGKSELRRQGRNIMREGWSDKKWKDAVDSLWRDPVLLRWSGFDTAGCPEATIDWSNTTKIFGIEPVVVNFGYYQFRNKLTHHIVSDRNEVDLSGVIDEGFFVFYFGYDAATKQQKLQYKYNPDEDEIREIYLVNTISAWLYWDATAQEAIYFGDERHGSEWNPQIHWWAHNVFNAIWLAGYDILDVVIGDGSLNAHAQFGVLGGNFMHEDIMHGSATIDSLTGLPVLWQTANGFWRKNVNPGYSFLRNTFMYYNLKDITGDVAECTDGYFMLMHVYAWNCINSPVVAIMGTNQYASKNDCCLAALDEIKIISEYLHHPSRLPLASICFEVNSAFTNDVKCRIVEPCTGQGAIIWIEEYNNWVQILIEISGGGGGIAEVLTEMSVTGDGTTEDKIHLVNDEDTPDADSYYGTKGTSTKGYHPLPTEAVQALTGATPTFDLDAGRGATITLAADTTITFSNLKANDTGHIEVRQDSTGGWELHFAGATIEIALNSYQAAGQVKLTGMASSKHIVVYWYTGAIMNLAVIFNVQP